MAGAAVAVVAAAGGAGEDEFGHPRGDRRLSGGAFGVTVLDPDEEDGVVDPESLVRLKALMEENGSLKEDWEAILREREELLRKIKTQERELDLLDAEGEVLKEKLANARVEGCCTLM
eukprot:GABV01009395.1.p1 GENE.GABV01009395.1~~GABV01009395.1.p1  ORF type:complete len:118 (-),score=44.41 GABV01009395.1:19-372(-)